MCGWLRSVVVVVVVVASTCVSAGWLVGWLAGWKKQRKWWMAWVAWRGGESECERDQVPSSCG
ncbi:hypothetical protein BKA81DRAFT_155106 [Phyllosticta paracitricarpa]